jgi:hypothetical protein
MQSTAIPPSSIRGIEGALRAGAAAQSRARRQQKGCFDGTLRLSHRPRARYMAMLPAAQSRKGGAAGAVPATLRLPLRGGAEGGTARSKDVGTPRAWWGGAVAGWGCPR